MKKINFLILLLPFISFSQKIFEFDYLITYRHINYKDSTSSIGYYLTNSKDNSYKAIFTSKDSTKYSLKLDQYEGYYSKVYFNKIDFDNAEILNIDCRYINKNKDANPYKYQVKYHDFINLPDTLLFNKKYNHYKLISTRSNNYKKRKKIGHYNYIIEKSTDFHLPILVHPTAFEEWKQLKTLVNGIFKEKFFTNYKGDIIEKYELISYKKIRKKITIPKNCDDKKNAL